MRGSRGGREKVGEGGRGGRKAVGKGSGGREGKEGGEGGREKGEHAYKGREVIVGNLAEWVLNPLESYLHKAASLS